MLPRSSLRALRARAPRRALPSSSSRSSSSSTSSPPPPSTASAHPQRDGTNPLKMALIGIGLGGGAYLVDAKLNHSAVARSLRTAVFGITLAVDFKLNFDLSNPAAIDRLHERAAKRLERLVDRNQGLYIKLAQSVALQAAVLPAPYREVFAGIFDNAPGVEWAEVERVFRKEFGMSPHEAFDSFDKTPIASASIAQVHRARLKREPGMPAWKEGEGWVAVKVRKEAIPAQMEWDLFSYRALLWSFEQLFDLPVSFVSKYVSEQMRKEVDLTHEAKNAEETARFLRGDKELRDKVTVPKVEWKWTGESVMTAEFVHACRLTDKKRLAEWNLSLKETMDAATELFSTMVFSWGHVQADPHPGNILVRPHPKRPSHPQIVLIDHGLYVDLPESFRLQYCLLWRSLFVGDVKTIEDIAESWGIKREMSNIFASLTLLRPHKLRKTKGEEEKKSEVVTKQEQQAGLKDRIKNMLESEELIPRELIFVTRAMRMMQGNNQAVGSVTNRINLLAHHAAAGLALHKSPSSSSAPYSSSRLSLLRSIHDVGFRTYLSETFRLAVFKVVLFAVDVGFLFTRVRAWCAERMGKKGEGLEDLLERQVTDMARNEFGVELDSKAFAG